jgi:hypothetical protein
MYAGTENFLISQKSRISSREHIAPWSQFVVFECPEISIHEYIYIDLWPQSTCDLLVKLKKKVAFLNAYNFHKTRFYITNHPIACEGLYTELYVRFFLILSSRFLLGLAWPLPRKFPSIYLSFSFFIRSNWISGFRSPDNAG